MRMTWWQRVAGAVSRHYRLVRFSSQRDHILNKAVHDSSIGM